MSFSDWVTESAHRVRTEPPREAVRESGMALAHGIVRRADRHLGRTIWDRGDWDVLVILDACRADLWDDVAPEYGLPTGTTIRSNASCSIDWIQYNFADCPEEIDDVGYVTANPFADHDAEHAKSADLKESPIAHLRPLYETEWGQVDTEPPIETVPPERVTDHAIEAWRNRDEYGFDRMVVHYMQPHEPYITRPEWSFRSPTDNPVLKNLVSEDYQAGTSPWQSMVSSGEVSIEEFWPVYKENLRWALDDVADRLLTNLEGDVVLSADHGNGLGEWGEWHHPPGAFGPAVRRVPWIELEATDEGTVAPTIDDAAAASRETTDRLEALGYL